MRSPAGFLAALALVLAACGHGGSPGTVPASSAPVATRVAPATQPVPSTAAGPTEPAWPERAASYVGGYLEASGRGSFDALAWLTPQSVLSVAGYPSGTGYDQALAWLRERARVAAANGVAWVPRRTFVDTGGATVALEITSTPAVAGQWLLVDLAIEPAGVASHEERPLGATALMGTVPDAAFYARTVADVDAGWATAESAAAVAAVTWLYDQYPVLAAFAAESAGLAGLAYADGARTVDRVRALDVPGGSGVWPAGWHLRTATLAADAPFPALAVDAPRAVDDGGTTRAEVARASGWYEVDTGDGCDRLALVTWSLAGGYPDPPRITDEAIRWDTAGLERCGIPGGGAAPAGWWDRVADPVLPEARTTSTYDAGGDASVALSNGTEELAALVGWGMGRFAEASIGRPRPARIAFEPAKVCEADPEASGQVDTTPGGYVATVCFGADQAGSDLARWFLLHELAHVWGYEHLDGRARAAFVAAAGLPAWDGTSIAYDDRGIEAAANVTAWGLLGGQPVPSSRLDRWSCPEVVELYRGLTGHDPLSTCPA